jgi:hypothetical protein
MTSKASKRRRASSPLSLRLTPEEREQLHAAAGRRTVSDYIRARLFGGPESAVASEAADSARLSPETRQRLLAQILGTLGQSAALRSLGDLAEAARIGVLPASPDVLAEIRAACAAILEMRDMLLRALGLRPPENTNDDS